MSRLEDVWAKAAAARQASAAVRQSERFMKGRGGIAALDKLPILRCTLSTLSNRPEPSFFQAEHAILHREQLECPTPTTPSASAKSATSVFTAATSRKWSISTRACSASKSPTSTKKG